MHLLQNQMHFLAGAQVATLNIQNPLRSVSAVATTSVFKTRMKIAMEKVVLHSAARQTQRTHQLQKQMHLLQNQMHFLAGAQVATLNIQNPLRSVSAVATTSVFKTRTKIAMEKVVLRLVARRMQRTHLLGT